jgi:ketosteroid isomerase-like protein
MKLRPILVLSSAAALLAACAKPSPQGFKDEVLAADKAFNAASAKDGPKAAFLAFIAPDAKLLSSDDQGNAAVENVFMQLPPTATLSREPGFVDVSGSGDLGYTWGRYTLIVRSPKGKQPFIQMGNYATVWKRQADGGWKVVLEGNHPDGK